MTPTPPAVAATPKRMTVDEYWDFVNLPENAGKRFELRRGEVVEMSRSRHPHGRAGFRAGVLLERYAEDVGRGYVVTDSGLVLDQGPGSVVGPDAAYYANADDFGDLDPKWAESPPVVVVEVLSPNDKPTQVNEKIADYLASGVKVVWLIDYEERKVTVYRPPGQVVVLRGDEEIAGGEELPGFACRVSDLFKMPAQLRAARPAPPAA